MKATSAGQFEGAGALPSPGTPDVRSFTKALLTAHHARDGFLHEVGVADATWAMLLDLFLSHEQPGRLSLSDLYSSVAAPKATTLRAITRLVDKGHLVTEADPGDGRRTLVRLTDESYLQISEVVKQMQEILTASSENPHRGRPSLPIETMSGEPS